MHGRPDNAASAPTAAEQTRNMGSPIGDGRMTVNLRAAWPRAQAGYGLGVTVRSPGSRASNGQVRPFHDHAPKHTTPSTSAPSPNPTTSGGVVAKMKIHPSSATRLGAG